MLHVVELGFEKVAGNAAKGSKRLNLLLIGIVGQEVQSYRNLGPPT